MSVSVCYYLEGQMKFITHVCTSTISVQNINRNACTRTVETYRSTCRHIFIDYELLFSASKHSKPISRTAYNTYEIHIKARYHVLILTDLHGAFMSCRRSGKIL